MLIEILVQGALGWIGLLFGLFPQEAAAFPDIGPLVAVLRFAEGWLPISEALTMMGTILGYVALIVTVKFALWLKSHLPVIGGGG